MVGAWAGPNVYFEPDLLKSKVVIEKYFFKYKIESIEKEEIIRNACEIGKS